MGPQIARTVQSLSPGYQHGASAEDYEILIVDNGSPAPVDRSACESWGAAIRWLSVADATPSPARAVNLGIAESRGSLVGVMVDGARLASPGVVRCARLGGALDDRAVVLSQGFHLGSEPQQSAVGSGYDEEAEAELLAKSGWEEDGYRLFDVSVPAASSRGEFEVPHESNAIFMRREMWDELGGYDEAFASPGGGLVNIDTLVRALELPDALPVVLIGEATFHQVHGGVTTNRVPSPERWAELYGEYVRIRGKEFEMPAVSPVLLGVRPPRSEG